LALGSTCLKIGCQNSAANFNIKNVPACVTSDRPGSVAIADRHIVITVACHTIVHMVDSACVHVSSERIFSRFSSSFLRDQTVCSNNKTPLTWADHINAVNNNFIIATNGLVAQKAATETAKNTFAADMNTCRVNHMNDRMTCNSDYDMSIGDCNTTWAIARDTCRNIFDVEVCRAILTTDLEACAAERQAEFENPTSTRPSNTKLGNFVFDLIFFDTFFNNLLTTFLTELKNVSTFLDSI
jgi:hypothetical protein